MLDRKINHTIVKDISFSLLEEGISVKVRADGYSMYPAIKPGSLIYIEPLAHDRWPCPGEIVAWKRDSGFVVHRLVKIIRNEDKTYFITRGDSCARDDQPVETVAGRVVRIENDNGTLMECSMETRPNYNLNRAIVICTLIIKKIFSGKSK